MDRADYFAKRVEAIEIQPRSIAQLLEAMGQTGFQGKSLARCLDVLTAMLRERDTTIFLGYAGSMSTTGQWKLIRWLIENRYVDVLVSTGANISEDVFEALGFSYYQGDADADDRELLRLQIDRYYDVYADELQYRQLESFIGDFMLELDRDRVYSSAEFLHRFGEYQARRGMQSITEAAYRAGVPVFSPGMADSGFGVAARALYKERGMSVTVDQMRDFIQLGEIGERAGSTAVIYIGGGVPKDTIQLVTVMTDLGRGGEDVYPHKYAVQITTDSPQWGGLSGCTFEEAVSWGKIDAEGERAVCYCDATIALPLLLHGLAERGPFERTAPDFGWLLTSKQQAASVS